MKKFLFVSMPFNIGVGGYKRSYNVLPKLSKKLSSDFNVVLYIPFNAIRTAMKFYIEELTNTKIIDTKDCTEIIHRAAEIVYENIKYLEKMSAYSLEYDYRILRKMLELNTNIFEKEMCKPSNYTSLSNIINHLIEHTRPFIIEILERKLWNYARKYLDLSNMYAIYSHHETVDALAVVANAVRPDVRVIILLQSDLEKSFAERLVMSRLLNHIYEHAHGSLNFLSISPQPILDSRALSGYVRLARLGIIDPPVAIDKSVLEYSKRKKNKKYVVYFGRISLEKGIIDLLKAWKIINLKDNDMRLTIIGKPDSKSVYDTFMHYLRELKNVRYVGYIPPKRLFDIVSRHYQLAYPSYKDSFSLTVLESLAMGLRVVAYDIYVLRYIYSISEAVTLIKPGDIKALAEAIITNYEQDILKSNKFTKKIIEKYSSWERVVNAEYNKIKAFIR